MSTPDDFTNIAKEYLEAARQAGKAETSGLVVKLQRTLEAYHAEQKATRELLYMVAIATLLLIYTISAVYVFTSRVTPQTIEKSVASALADLVETE